MSLVCILALLTRRQWVENRKLAFSPVFFVLTGAFFVLLGSYLTTKIRAGSEKDHLSHFYNSGDLVGILLQERISRKNGAQRFQARTFSLGSRPCQGNIFVKIEIDPQEGRILYGDTLWTRNSLYRIGPPLNPGAFDFRAYAARKNIFHQLHLNRGEFLMKPGNKKGLLRSSIQLNRDLQSALEKVLNEPQALSVAKALLLGDRNEIPDALLNSFKGAGAMHVLAISGLHVGIVHVIFMFLSRPLLMLRGGRILRVVLIVSGLWTYALITGLAVSALRSVSMFTLLTLGIALNRKTGLLNNLVNSAFVLLIINPMLLFDVGFQLSYSALAGIGLGAIWIEKRDRQKNLFRRFKSIF